MSSVLTPIASPKPLQTSLFPLWADEGASVETAHVEAYTAARGAVPVPSVIPMPAPTIVVPHKEYVPRTLEERWYQTRALESIARVLPKGAKRKEGKGYLLKSPTGCGKTSIASRAIGSWLEAGERVLILVDLERLLDQMRDDLAEEGIYPLIEKAQHSALSAFGRHGNCVLASMQTLYQGRLEKWASNSFDKIVIDECHELKWTHIVAHFKEAPYLGLTATPIRADGKSLKEHFHHPYISTLSMREAIEGFTGEYDEEGHKTYGKPFLSRIRIESVPAPDIDLSNIRLVGKDFDQRELDQEIWKHTNFLASAIIQHSGDRRSWIYCPKTATADAIAEAMRDMGASCASYHSKTPDPVAVFEQFKRGELQYLTNVNMLIKGVNVPPVNGIWRVRASMNVAQATQEIGRGTRLSPATGKTDCVVYEFDFATGDKKLAGVIDAILDGADDPDAVVSKADALWRNRVRDRAFDLIKSRKEQDPILALDFAEKQLKSEDEAAQKAKDDARRAKYERVEVASTTQKYDPFAGLDKAGGAASEARQTSAATPEQMARLEELSKGVIKATQAKHWAFEQAEKRIKDLEVRVQYKYASEPQLKLMIDTLGIDSKAAHKLRKWEASNIINERLQEMATALEACGHDYTQTRALPPWRIAQLYNSNCMEVI